MEDRMRRFSIGLIRVLEVDNGGNVAEAIFKKIMAENFPR